MTRHYTNTTGPSYVAGKGWRLTPPGSRDGKARDWDSYIDAYRVEASDAFTAMSRFTLGSAFPGAEALYLQSRQASYVSGNKWDVTLEYQGLERLSVPQIYDFQIMVRDRELTRAEVFPNDGTNDFWQVGIYKVKALRFSSVQNGGTMTFFSRQPLPLSVSALQGLIQDGQWNPPQDTLDWIRNTEGLRVYVAPHGKVPRSAQSEKLTYGPALYKHTLTYVNERELDIT